MLRNHTGLIKWPLTASAGGVSPTFTHSDQAKFKMGDVPIKTGNLPNYMMGIAVTIAGTIQNDATTAAVVRWDNLLRGLVESIRIENAFHGVPISDNHWKGWAIDPLEFLWNGYGYFGPRGMVRVAGALSFKRTFLIPLHFGHGDKPHHTAQLALFFKNAELQINTAASTVLTGISTGCVVTAATIRATALLLPDPEIRIGPATQHVFYRDAAASNQEVVSLDSLGNTGTIEGVELGAGLAFLGLWGNAIGGLGSALSGITELGFTARGQKKHKDIQAVVCEFRDAIGGRALLNNDNTLVAPTDMGGFPWIEGSYTASQNPVALGLAANDSLIVMPIGILPHRELETTKLQIFEGTQSFELTGGATTGTHHIAAAQFHSWTPQKLEDAKAEIMNSGLPGALGMRGNLSWAPKVTRKQAMLDPRKARLLPMKLTATAA